MGKVGVWKNVNGQTEAIRTHLASAHAEDYRNLVISFQLKGHEQHARAPAGVGEDGQVKTREPFTFAGFHERLVRWIVSDD